MERLGLMLENQVNDDLKEAMLAKQPVKVAALRSIKAAFMVAKSEKGAGIFTENRAIQALKKLAKQREESADIYSKNNRNDLYEQEMAEFVVISAYLPSQAPQHLLEKMIEDELNVTPQPKMGEVIKFVTKSVSELGMIVDGKLLSTLVKQKLEQ